MKSVYKRNIQLIKDTIALRVSLEDKMIKRLVAVAQDNGFVTKRTAGESGWIETPSIDDVFNVVFITTESHIEFYSESLNEIFTCHVVLYKDGWDCLTDFDYNQDKHEFFDSNIVQPLQDYAQRLEAEV